MKYYQIVHISLSVTLTQVNPILEQIADHLAQHRAKRHPLLSFEVSALFIRMDFFQNCFTMPSAIVVHELDSESVRYKKKTSHFDLKGVSLPLTDWQEKR